MRTVTPTGPARAKKDPWFPLILLLLGLLTAFLWFCDPSHADSDKSRVDWPRSGP